MNKDGKFHKAAERKTKDPAGFEGKAGGNGGLFSMVYAWYMKMKLRQKIAALVVCNLLLVAASGAAGIYAVHGISGRMAAAGVATGVQEHVSAEFYRLLVGTGSILA